MVALAEVVGVVGHALPRSPTRSRDRPAARSPLPTLWIDGGSFVACLTDSPAPTPRLAAGHAIPVFGECLLPPLKLSRPEDGARVVPTPAIEWHFARLLSSG
jgi:hypothetical protein